MNYKDVIEARYNRENWQQLLHDIFLNKVTFWNNPSPVSVNSRLAKDALNLGKITLSDGESIAIYEVELTETVDIERNRRGIRDMLTTDWRNLGYAGAFMFCYRKNESVLRFSYVSETWGFNKEGEYEKISTDTKRYTYLLGEGHRSRTAIQQFEKLKNSPQALKDITKAFSVEAISDMFFDGYKKQYEDIIQYITGKRMVKVANKWEEQITNEPCEEIMQEFSRFQNPEKSVRDYVKKLMGRLVFLQFLQKKGWLGVANDAEWGSGDKEFIQHLFAQCDDKDSFIDNVLESLFNDLNSEDNKMLPQYRTPYLNGGLFERDATDETLFLLPAKYMQSLLDFFASYNFTIDENDPDDAEVGVDPEMLGRIFENLLEDNKDKGAFYTPKEIVSYMCRESLIAYLQTDVEDDTTKESLRQFVTTHNRVYLGDNEKFRQQVVEALKKVKICDPAIGSGAFPMGLLRELFLCRTAIEGFDKNKLVEIKKHIIQQNIYGVDIDRGAVDIARLRFWLSLIVDEETPHALPNLDFKIMQGNSLLEQYKGVDLSTMTEKKYDQRAGLSWIDNMVDVYREELRSMLEEYYDCADHIKKQSLRTKIIENVKQQLSEQSINVDFGELDLSGNNQFFLLRTWFYDVFSQGGFDIVIGNPPYVQLQNNSGELASLYQGQNYKTFARTGDIYCLFYERGWQLLKEGGHLCYITSNKWMRAGYGEKTREFFANKTNPMLLIDFAGVKIFESATVDTNILLFSKSNNQHETVCAVTNKQNKDSVKNLSDFVQQQSVVCDFSNSESWVILSPIEQSIKRKIEAVGTPLKDWDISIYRGVLTGCNEAFIISTEKRDEILTNCKTEDERKRTAELIRPILRGRDIKRYGYVDNGLFLINTHNGIKGKLPRIKIEDYPAVKTHLDQYWDKISTRADKGDTPYNLRNCAYMEDFFKPKVMWKIIGCNINFCFDEKQMICNNAVDIMVGERNSLIQFVGIMNSKLFDWYLKLTTEAEVQGGGIQLYVTTLEKTLLKLDFPQTLTETIYNRICGKVDDLFVDEKIFDAYQLTDEEKHFIMNDRRVNRN